MGSILWFSELWCSSSEAGTPVGRLDLAEPVWNYALKCRDKWLIAKMRQLLTLLCPFTHLSYLQSCHVGIYLAINLLQNGFSSPLLGRVFHRGYCGVKLMKHRFPFAQMLAFPCINSLWLEVKFRLGTRGFFSCWKGIIRVSQQDTALNSEPCQTKAWSLKVSPHYTQISQCSPFERPHTSLSWLFCVNIMPTLALYPDLHIFHQN